MFTEQDLAAIRAAIARGERTVEFADRRVTYRSIEELLTAEAHIISVLASGDTSRRSKQTVLVGCKAL